MGIHLHRKGWPQCVDTQQQVEGVDSITVTAAGWGGGRVGLLADETGLSVSVSE